MIKNCPVPDCKGILKRIDVESIDVKGKSYGWSSIDICKCGWKE